MLTARLSLMTVLATVLALVVLLIASSNAPFSARSSAAAVCPASISYGETITCSIDAAAEEDSFTFSGLSGERILVHAIETSGTLSIWGGGSVAIHRPDDSELCNNFVNAYETECVLDADGVHAIKVSDRSSIGTGNYNLHLQRLNDPLGCGAVSVGAPPVSGSVSASAAIGCHRFDGAAAQRILINAIETSGTLSIWGGSAVRLLRPDGSEICNNFVNSYETECVLDTTGTHTVLVFDRSSIGTGNYNLYLQRLNDPLGCGAVSVGAPPVSGSVSAIAAIGCHRFDGAAAQRILINAIETSGTLSIWGGSAVRLLRPDGSEICNNFVNAYETECVLDTTGTHTVLVFDRSSIGTGNYNLYLQRLNDPVACSALAHNDPPMAASIDAVAQIGCHTFGGDASDDVVVYAVETSGTLGIWGGGAVRVLRPDGSELCDNFGSAHKTICTLDTTGDHLVLVADSHATGAYCIQLQTPPGSIIDCAGTSTPTMSPSTATPTGTATATPTGTATATPTGTATATPTGTATATPTGTATATPTGTVGGDTETPFATSTPTDTPSTYIGDLDCSGETNPIDSLKLLHYDAGLPALPQTEPCTDIGQPAWWGWLFGDVNCSGSIDPVDSLLILRYDVGFGVTQGPGCPPIGP